MNVLEQAKLDRMLLELDGTDNKINLGANAMLGAIPETPEENSAQFDIWRFRCISILAV